MKIDKTITDIACPKCGSEHTDTCNTDEIEFEPSGKGHYYADCYCADCKNQFRQCFEFEYNITKEWTRK